MTIDIATRFPVLTFAEAKARAQETERWVFEDLISSSATMIYGRSNVGKSYLVSSMLLSLVLADREFLGMQPTDPFKEWRPVILCTDPGVQEEYAERMALATDADLDIPMYSIGVTRRPEEWTALTDHLIDSGRNFAVLDNLMGATGDSNDTPAISTVYDGLNRLVLRGIPVVVIHHESEHGRTNVVHGAPPMGMSNSVQKSRVWIQVRQTSKKQFRGGNTGLIVQSNKLDQPIEIIAEPKTGPDYRVISRGPWVKKDEEEKPKQKRAPETLDQNAEMADYVVNDCQGKGLNETAGALAEKFGKSNATCRDSLMRGALSAMLRRDGDGKAAVWTRV
ncbi:AAA family ATPase [Pseudonocardia sp. RS010]|uniref:AAA family ATPase n=1 Tax=Pseudonocardia sp. RS010 TaxID=3385979 RepID=UPI0039A2CB3C